MKKEFNKSYVSHGKKTHPIQDCTICDDCIRTREIFEEASLSGELNRLLNREEKSEIKALKGLQEYVFSHGKKYISSILPSDIPMMKIAHCFDNCIGYIYTKNKKYKYVEGFAKHHLRDKWYAHAWLTDGEHVFDPTWSSLEKLLGKELVMNAEYFGIELDHEKVVNFMIRTSKQGVLVNAWRHPEWYKMAKEYGFIL